ncbi:hypothetical protein ACS0TY_009041 [Phlomoides rotata]
MDELYGIHSTGDFYADKALMSPENLMVAAEYGQYHYDSVIPVVDHRHRLPAPLESEDVGFQCSVVSESASVNHDDEHASSVIKAKIASHPSYPKLLRAYIDCQKVGAPPEIACLLDEIRREKEKDVRRHDAVSVCFGRDPQLDEFMETFCDVLVKYKTDLSKPFDEATSFLNNIENQLTKLCKDDGALSSDEELSGGETEMHDPQMKTEDADLKDRLLRMYGEHINTLKLEFSKKKKKGKLPKEARQALLEWWNVHYKWPYPTVSISSHT